MFATILRDRGFVEKVSETKTESGIKHLEIQLKYVNGEHAIRGLSRISKPGRRSYCGYREIPRTLGGLGISILSTPQGIMDDKSARKNKLGGEVDLQRLVDFKMSRIGKLPVEIPSGVNVSLENDIVSVKGPKGELSEDFSFSGKVNIEEKSVSVSQSRSKVVMLKLSMELPVHLLPIWCRV